MQGRDLSSQESPQLAVRAAAAQPLDPEPTRGRGRRSLRANERGTVDAGDRRARRLTGDPT